MEIESVRSLKSEVLEEIIIPASRRAHEGLGRRFLRKLQIPRWRGVRTFPPSIALGIGRGSPGRDFNLAVRIQLQNLRMEQEIGQKIEMRAKGETDIRYVGVIKKSASATGLPWHQMRQRPLLCGVSVGHPNVTAGTLGCFVRERGRPEFAILSNNHVLADEDRAAVGDAILQPGTFDSGTEPADRIGSLLRSIPLKAGSENIVDAAIATIDGSVPLDTTTLFGLGKLRGSRVLPIEPGDKVTKIGRTTGLTHGVVTAIELDDVIVRYDMGDLRFNQQIEIEGAETSPFSAGGDSGSLIVDDAIDACALLFAGSTEGGTNGKGLTYANNLKDVLSLLRIELVSEGYA